MRICLAGLDKKNLYQECDSDAVTHIDFIRAFKDKRNKLRSQAF